MKIIRGNRMKKFFIYLIGIYIFFALMTFLSASLKLPKTIYEISNKTIGLPEKVKIIDIERDYDISRDNHFFVLGDNNHIYQIDPDRKAVVKDIHIKGLNNPNGFSLIRFYLPRKHIYEIYIADTDNSRIVQLKLPLNNENTTVEAQTFITIQDAKPKDVSFYRQDYDNSRTSNNIAVLTNNKIMSFNTERKQLKKIFDLMLQVNKQMIPFKNLPYYYHSFLSNWGTGPQLRRDDYLEIIQNNKNISHGDISLNLGKISRSEFYVIPDNDNKLIWISSPMSYTLSDEKTIHDSIMYRTIKYKKDINIAIRYGKHREENLLVIAYQNEYGLSYNHVGYGIAGKFFSISQTIFRILITPFIIPFLGRQ